MLSSITNRNENTGSHHLQSIIFGLGIIVVAITTGIVVALGQPLILLILVGTFMGLALMARPLALLWVVLIGALVVAGVVGLYLPSFDKIRWGVAAAATGLALVSLISRLANPKSIISQHPSSILVWGALFFGISVISSLLNTGISSDTVIGLKGYFQVWSILLAFAWLKLDVKSVDNFVKAIVPFSLLQIPFALHQFIVLVPLRATVEAAQKYFIVAPDIVVGTFVGSLMGGGGSAILAALQITTLGLLLAYWRNGFISWVRLVILAMLITFPLLLNEAKIMVVILPFTLLIIFRDQVLRKPVHFLVGAVVVALSLVMLLLVYSHLPGESAKLSPVEQLSQTVDYNFGERGYGTLALNRTTVLTFWWNQHNSINDLLQILIGHGPGVANDSSISVKNLASGKYAGMGIGLTAVSALLWEVGILGLISAFGMLFSAFIVTIKLAKEVQLSKWHRTVLLGLQAGIMIMIISLSHNNFFMFDIGFQALLMLMLGYILYWQQHIQTEKFNVKKF